jgi:hypothetical protein
MRRRRLRSMVAEKEISMTVVKWTIALALLALPFVLVASGTFSKRASNDITVTDTDVIYFSKQMMRNFMRDPDKVEFPPDSEFKVEPLGDNHWRVQGSLLVYNKAKKQQLRMPMTIEMSRSGTRWKLVKRENEFNELTKAERARSWTAGAEGKSFGPKTKP